jgi:recombination protein RecA
LAKNNGKEIGNKCSIDKRQLVEEAVSRIDKQYGKGSIMNLGSFDIGSDVEVISTGSILIDSATGIGGIPRGRVVEIYGPEASGKTTIALQAIAEAQKKGGLAAFIDAEHALDMGYAVRLGIKPDELFLSQPDYGEQALDIVEMLVRSGGLDIIVVDSVAALVPKSEVEGEMGDTHVGLQARLMSQALRKLTPLVHKSRVSLVFINQIRQNISAFAFAPKETTTGGNALKFYSSLRMDVRRTEALKDREGKHYGNKVSVKISKNKISTPFRIAATNIIFGNGVNRFLEMADLSISMKVIQQSGSWYSMGSARLCQGKDALVAKMQNESDFYDSVFEAIELKHTEVSKPKSFAKTN